jgi:hypothetical protein
MGAAQLDGSVLQLLTPVCLLEKRATGPHKQLTEASQAAEELYALKCQELAADNCQLLQACSRRIRTNTWCTLSAATPL